MFEIAAERPEDAAAIEHLLDRAFGPDRHAKTSYRYREGVEPERRLCLIARDDGGGGRVVGSIRHWPVVIGAAATPALLLGPLAVEAGHRGRGVGGALMRRSLQTAAAAAGHRVVLLVGDLGYYRRFGFEPAPPAIVMPGERPDRLLVTALAPGALDGVSGTVRPAEGVPFELGRGLRGVRIVATARRRRRSAGDVEPAVDVHRLAGDEARPVAA